ncbi:hypothetical protein [Inquilinus limosus]|uniref:Uncharacterized protein n=1 Tax=Inquilinus limosus MP06 TaxID=1398085 RepID=A0A0A0DAD8_9PROT|nr:hypothetical protein [Inquilinus limosus]KGM34995.1 hypothetical protein P409_07050 [Inquilinus limosus MP06]
MITLTLRLIAAAAVIGLSAPASALTPQQCAAIKGSFIKGMQYQMKALDQGKLLVQQKPIILSIILSLRTKYPDLKDADLEDLRRVGDRVNDAALALDNEADMEAHQDAALVIRDLCP